MYEHDIKTFHGEGQEIYASSLDLGEGTVLTPVFEPQQRTFSVEIRANGELRAVKSERQAYTQPVRWVVQDLITETVSSLKEHGLRQVTEREQYFLYSGLLAAQAANEPPFESADDGTPMQNPAVSIQR
ncbi:hypothetical protein [Streptomyces sp. G-5]|uniref:hypothetical protein n=1 Tax=Streptomyces sp. G-5 TaxID=2977231 RepID=UPI0021CED111|nr:hypothetical protein [Streptomyces sp. G-5]MCU4750265.1 hypothetical protein [Streptomyces sp. G-5]